MQKKNDFLEIDLLMLFALEFDLYALGYLLKIKLFTLKLTIIKILQFLQILIQTILNKESFN